MKYQVYKDLQNQWRWRLVAQNGNIVADSGESYHNRQDAISEIEKIKNSPVEIESEQSNES